MKLLVSILFISVFSSSYSQSTQTKNATDSLLMECRRLSAYPDSLAYLGWQLKNLGEKSGYDLATFEGFFAIGYSEYRRGQFAIAADYYDSAIQVLKNDPKAYYNAYTRILRNYGIAKTRISEYDDASKAFMDLLKLGEENNKPREVAYAFNQLGVLEKYQNRFNEALEYYKKALAITDSIENEGLRFSILKNLSIAQAAIKKGPESMRYKKLALNSATKMKRPELIAEAKNNLAVEYRELMIYDSSMVLLRENLAFYKEAKMEDDITMAYQNIGNNHMLLENYDSGLYYFNLAASRASETTNWERIVQLQKLKGRLFYLSNDYDSAIHYLTIALNQSIEYELRSQSLSIYEYFAEVYEAMEDYKTANKFLHYSAAIKDSIFTEVGLKTLNEILTKYKVAEKDAEIKKLSFYQKLLTPLGLIVIALLMFALWYYLRWKKSRIKLETTLEENEQFQSEIIKNRNEIIELKSKAVLQVDDITYIKSDGHYLEIFLSSKGQPEVDRNRITEILAKLPSKFVQIHRSHIVNVDQVKVKYASKVVLLDGTELPISRTYKDLLSKAIENRS